MRISLIIPTLNAGARFETLLSSLSMQDVKPLEIIVIDSTSDDNTVEIAKRFGAITIEVPRRSFNHGKTRNMAAIEARGDTLVFMTQDALPLNSTLLGALTAPLRMHEVSAAFGRHLPRPGASPLEIFARQFNYPASPSTIAIRDIEEHGIRSVIFSDVCSAVEKKTFMEAGMFPPVRANEDMLMAARLILSGHKVAYVPDAAVFHSHNYSLLRQFRRYYNIGSSLKDNPWVLKYAPAEGDGLRFMTGQISFLMDKRRYFWIPYIFLEAAAKYAGYRLGLIAG
ncbi:MAG TPA: glycosyltransferase [Thermodesulfovibrionales bacterium]|nr:glycosyltransferase [Thermodesulfovibrionales bacterium]